MNFAEPSGSSPALNPPENIKIWDSRIAFSKASTLSVMFCSRHIFKYNALCISTCCLECFRGIILTVCSREYRNKYVRFCHFMFAYINVFRIVKTGIRSSLSSTPERVGNTFSNVPVQARKCFLHGNHFIAHIQTALFCPMSYQSII